MGHLFHLIGLDLHTYLLCYHFSNFEDNQLVVATCSHLDPLMGSLFDVSLDVLKYGVPAFALTIMLPIHFIILTSLCSQSCTEYGGYHLSFGVDSTSFGPDLGLNFMALSPQVSFGPDLRKFKYSEHQHSLSNYAEIKHMI